MTVSSEEFLNIQTARECGFTLKRARDIIRTYSQMHRTDKYSQHGAIIWSVWLNSWVFVYNLSGCGFESRCSHLFKVIYQNSHCSKKISFFGLTERTRMRLDGNGDFLLNICGRTLFTIYFEVWKWTIKYTLLYKQRFYKQHQSEIGKKPSKC